MWHVLAALAVVFLALWALASAAGRAQAAVTSAKGGNGGGRQRSVRQEAKIAWQKARATDWLEWRRHERKTSTGHAAVTSGTLPPRKQWHWRDRAADRIERMLGFKTVAPDDPRAERLAVWGDDVNGHGEVKVIPPAARQAPPAAPATPNGSPGRNTAMPAYASGSPVEQLVDGVNKIHAHAQAGGLHAKHGAVQASHEGSVRFAAMAAMLARAMSEPGMNYGPEITEPIAKAGTHLQAAAMAWSEADAALTSLEGMTVSDLAFSSRQAPHHSQLSENGSH